MEWVEIINARIAANANPWEMERLFLDIRNNVAADRKEAVRMKIYRSGNVDSDWSIHLHRETGERAPGRTGLGIKLADIIRPMALVDHSIWVEEDRRDSSRGRSGI